MSPVEYWTVLPQGREVHLFAVRDSDQGRQTALLKAPLKQFKAMVNILPIACEVETILVALCRDGKKHGAPGLVRWLDRSGRSKGFTVEPIGPGPASTAEGAVYLASQLPQPH